eukprot:Skav236627  [mRNA]  locus=C9064138:838:1197:- [translate_table: standard]
MAARMASRLWEEPTTFHASVGRDKEQEDSSYMHATYKPEKHEIAIAHMKVDSAHLGPGLGGLLINAAEDCSKSIGWSARARQCYAKARFESSSEALWGSKQRCFEPQSASELDSNRALA